MLRYCHCVFSLKTLWDLMGQSDTKKGKSREYRLRQMAAFSVGYNSERMAEWISYSALYRLNITVTSETCPSFTATEDQPPICSLSRLDYSSKSSSFLAFIAFYLLR
ncbi:hypothetical protein J6590_032296 [Homalodisca vitripennis]|nr:hypothetical protein J6590_032296 [Homalodisca vitripennis]